MSGLFSENSILKNLKKDFRIEFRNRSALSLSVFFAVIATLSISLAGGGMIISARIQGILLWIVLFFSAMNGLSHIFIREEEHGTALFLRMNSDPSVVFTAKLLFNISLFFFMEIIIFPLYFFFMYTEITDLLSLILIIIAGGIAMSCAVTILAAIASKAGGRGPLFTIISFPVVLPVIWVASVNSANVLSIQDYSVLSGVVFLLAFSAMITALSYILFEYIWIEE